MTMHLRSSALLAITTAFVVLLPGAGIARADGLPVANVDTTRVGIGDPDGGFHLYALPLRGRTEILRVPPLESGETLDSLSVRGTLAVPGVSWDSTTSGLSADGLRLVTIEPRRSFPRSNTRFVVIRLTEKRMRVERQIRLNGDYSFDAISPDGSLMYLIHYTSRRDPTRYEVRKYDLNSGEMDPQPVLDSRAAPLAMRGFPITRTSSADGRWQYTLYDGGGGTPFVHALDTVEANSICVAVPALEGARNLFETRLALSDDGTTITAHSEGETVATISTETWDVVDMRGSGPFPPLDPPAEASGDGVPAWWALPAAGLFALGWAGMTRVRRHRTAAALLPPDPFVQMPVEETDAGSGAQSRAGAGRSG